MNSLRVFFHSLIHFAYIFTSIQHPDSYTTPFTVHNAHSRTTQHSTEKCPHTKLVCQRIIACGQFFNTVTKSETFYNMTWGVNENNKETTRIQCSGHRCLTNHTWAKHEPRPPFLAKDMPNQLYWRETHAKSIMSEQSHGSLSSGMVGLTPMSHTCSYINEGRPLMVIATEQQIDIRIWFYEGEHYEL